MRFLQEEWSRLQTAVRTLDQKTTFVLVFAAFAVILQFVLGDRALFRTHLADAVPEYWRGLATWGWWFGMQGLLGFILPVAGLFFFFPGSARDHGLGLGHWRLASAIAGAYLALVALGTWALSDGATFQDQYPHYRPATRNWTGFLIFGTRHTLGLYAIFVQALPFAALHVSKPWPEALLSIIGGIGLGALVWRCRSFWIAVPIHAAQMIMLDLWCTLRVRTDVSGIGPEAVATLLHRLGN
ncbi:MAG: CPBP family intramembrane metalloprotease [Bacteroidetes bacterium SW_9_63_38]|nr:MAG: CPBP family intramembrane metalloprotease [Bacteroidetes bacterium SW_9_63_38]